MKKLLLLIPATLLVACGGQQVAPENTPQGELVSRELSDPTPTELPSAEPAPATSFIIELDQPQAVTVEAVEDAAASISVPLEESRYNSVGDIVVRATSALTQQQTAEFVAQVSAIAHVTAVVPEENAEVYNK